jgi:hypothetical protein
MPVVFARITLPPQVNLENGGALHPGIVHQDVDSAPTAQHRLHHGAHARFAADVHGYRLDLETIRP